MTVSKGQRVRCDAMIDGALVALRGTVRDVRDDSQLALVKWDGFKSVVSTVRLVREE